uniref:Secreted protein n=1 Tax=Macrostomum lignano TaxID=282301 RepID=A0A1I8FS94_9PLAT
ERRFLVNQLLTRHPLLQSLANHASNTVIRCSSLWPISFEHVIRCSSLRPISFEHVIRCSSLRPISFEHVIPLLPVFGQSASSNSLVHWSTFRPISFEHVISRYPIRPISEQQPVHLFGKSGLKYPSFSFGANNSGACKCRAKCATIFNASAGTGFTFGQSAATLDATSSTGGCFVQPSDSSRRNNSRISRQQSSSGSSFNFSLGAAVAGAAPQARGAKFQLLCGWWRRWRSDSTGAD